MKREEAIQESRELLKEEKVSGFDHVSRVAYWCRYMGEKEGADLDALEIAAFLHDIGLNRVGLKTHHTESAAMAGNLLREKNVPEERIKQICRIIERHAMHAPEAEKIEEKIINDADRIDHMGAIGIVRAIARAILVKKDYTGDVADVPELLRQVVASTKKRVYTDIAKKIVDDKATYVEKFIEQLEKELAEAESSS
ncbi:MAG: HD domain-containing protein [Syntrophaceae bacterium]|nr:HD domain-containing protein [Syntrophaceae bacterium]